jgi:hypothetical protein
MFGNIDEEQRAERAIQTLHQTKSVTAYTGEFQLLAGRIDWDDKALTAQYYRGLKEEVKDDIVRGGRPGELLPMIEKAIDIDSRLYERRMERRGQYSGGHQRKGKKDRTSRWEDRMELDAVSKKGNPSKDEMNRRRDKGLCFECGLPGHQAASHKKGNPKGKGKP